MSDKLKVVDKILISLVDKFNPMVVVTEETKDLSTMIIQRLMGSLRSYKQGFYVTKKNPQKNGEKSSMQNKNKFCKSGEAGKGVEVKEEVHVDEAEVTTIVDEAIVDLIVGS
ncbi:hypothetical protein PVK06_019697 [Gossypium arboreum]|uniref:Gag-pol polyprotein n=1 Tax=Gossypium arboreum TaxID=29729 RepID=A0ABR0PL30_GOSAR|nr:hypothetical protein PVK06_019697 [Gossypium arboreum]